MNASPHNGTFFLGGHKHYPRMHSGKNMSEDVRSYLVHQTSKAQHMGEAILSKQAPRTKERERGKDRKNCYLHGVYVHKTRTHIEREREGKSMAGKQHTSTIGINWVMTVGVDQSQQTKPMMERGAMIIQTYL